MLNVTPRLAVGMRYLPDEANWEDITMQRRCQDLTAADILPDTHDVMLLRERALAFLKQLPILSSMISRSFSTLFLQSNLPILWSNANITLQWWEICVNRTNITLGYKLFLNYPGIYPLSIRWFSFNLGVLGSISFFLRGSASQPGPLYNIREVVQLLQVDQKGRLLALQMTWYRMSSRLILLLTFVRSSRLRHHYNPYSMR